MELHAEELELVCVEGISMVLVHAEELELVCVTGHDVNSCIKRSWMCLGTSSRFTRMAMS